jgi:hypothetical protein
MPSVLTSWKEIAAHLGKSIRTVQRWERELGLPVRRPDRRRSGIVLADPAELDHWLHQQQPAHGNGNGNGKAAATGSLDTMHLAFARTRTLAGTIRERIQALQQTAELNRHICQAIQDRKLRRERSRTVALPA